MEQFSFDTWFAVRYVHVVSFALLTGGAFASMALCVSAAAAGDSRVTLVAVAIYERAFWLVAGVTVATGISNLGLKGDGLLGPDTNWGTALLVKLSAVLVLLRAVRGSQRFRPPVPRTARRHVRPKATVLMTLYGLGAMWAGLGLAHGRY